jgi:hydrogenase expression/formation protein HypD
VRKVFQPEETVWRELGRIPQSGLKLVPRYDRFDAIQRFGILLGEDEDNPNCRCGEVIVGKVEPHDCELFGNGCTPLNPIGPCMVSSEGTCAAWYKYGGTVAVGQSKESA